MAIPISPQLTKDELARLADRAGRRFIVVFTMVKSVGVQYNDPRARDWLRLLLKLTSELLLGTEVYKLYDSIFSTCADQSKRTFTYLFIRKAKKFLNALNRLKYPIETIK